jgi:hypothetical protein
MPSTKPYSIQDYIKAQEILESLKLGTEKTGRNGALEFAKEAIQQEINTHYYGK